MLLGPSEMSCLAEQLCRQIEDLNTTLDNAKNLLQAQVRLYVLHHASITKMF